MGYPCFAVNGRHDALGLLATRNCPRSVPGCGCIKSDEARLHSYGVYRDYPVFFLINSLFSGRISDGATRRRVIQYAGHAGNFPELRTGGIGGRTISTLGAAASLTPSLIDPEVKTRTGEPCAISYWIVNE